MALTGIVLVGFVFVHMAGNLQVLLGQEAINAYAHALQSLPAPILWGSRLFLLVCVVIHAVTAYQLIKENRAARPRANEVEVTKRAGWSSLKMGLTGSLLLAFVVFHLLHFTIRLISPEHYPAPRNLNSPLSSKLNFCWMDSLSMLMEVLPLRIPPSLVMPVWNRSLAIQKEITPSPSYPMTIPVKQPFHLPSTDREFPLSILVKLLEIHPFLLLIIPRLLQSSQQISQGGPEAFILSFK